MTPRLGPLLGLGLGLVIGCTAYGLLRILLPGSFAVAAIAPGICAGVGARLGRALGTPAEMRIIVFGALFAALAGEYALFIEIAELADVEPDVAAFTAHLTRSGTWLAFTIGFLVLGIFTGVRLLVGNDPLGDILAHGSDAVPPGAHGTPCPRCGSVQTSVADQTLQLECHQCDHRWRPGAPSGPVAEAPAEQP